MGRATPNQYFAAMSPEGQRMEKLSCVMAHSVFNAQEESDLAEYVRQCSQINVLWTIDERSPAYRLQLRSCKPACDADIVDFQPRDEARLGRRLQETQ